MATLIPILRYRDPAAAVVWLCEAFAFKKHFLAEESGALVHAQLSLGEALLFLGPDHDDDKYGIHSPLSLNGTNQCVYIATEEDIDDHCLRAQSVGAVVITMPHDTPYGGREYSCLDPERHVWSIGTYKGKQGKAIDSLLEA